MQYNKYRNIKTTVGGVTFDSRKEYRRAAELVLMERAHLISNLERQKRFELQPAFRNNKGEHVRAITYVADFVYDKGGVRHVEDVKSSATKKDKTYILKKKMFMFKFPDIIFIEND